GAVGDGTGGDGLDDGVRGGRRGGGGVGFGDGRGTGLHWHGHGGGGAAGDAGRGPGRGHFGGGLRCRRGSVCVFPSHRGGGWIRRRRLGVGLGDGLFDGFGGLGDHPVEGAVALRLGGGGLQFLGVDSVGVDLEFSRGFADGFLGILAHAVDGGVGILLHGAEDVAQARV